MSSASDCTSYAVNNRDNHDTHPGSLNHCAIHLNNHGAKLLEKGDYGSACVALCGALKANRTTNQRGGGFEAIPKLLSPPPDHGNVGNQQRHHQEMTQDESDRPRDTKQQNPKTGHLDPDCCSIKSINEKQKEDDEDSSVPAATDHIFRTPLTLSQQDDDDPVSIVSITSAILYNLALAQLLLAVERENDKCSPRMVGALQLYEIVYALQDAADDKNGSTRDKLPCLYLLGVINNCAYLHRLLNRPKKADRLFKHLLGFLMLLVIDEESDTSGLEFFFASTSHLILHDSRVARAA